MNWLSISKKVLFFCLALSTGLFLVQRILQAHDIEDPVIASIDDLATQAVLEEDALRGSIDDRSLAQRRSIVPLQSALVRPVLRSSHQGGKPFAFLAADKMYLIDRQGAVIGPAGELKHEDVPVLTGEGFLFDLQKKRVAGRAFEECVQLLGLLHGRDALLAGRLSEIQVHPQLGLIAIFSWTNALPVIIGHGNLEDKIKTLDIAFEQLTSSGLLDQARYLDAREKGHILLKKNG